MASSVGYVGFIGALVWVVVEEVRSGEWGIGGSALTTADVRALAAGHPQPVG